MATEPYAYHFHQLVEIHHHLNITCVYEFWYKFVGKLFIKTLWVVLRDTLVPGNYTLVPGNYTLVPGNYILLQ